MDPLTLSLETPDQPDVRALLVRHFELMRASSPEESCHVMPPDSVAEAGVVMLGARGGGVLLGIGALKALDATHGELKSMHTAAQARGQGIARLILNDLIARAQQMGMTQLSLETGSAPLFAPARALYKAAGFVSCAPFGTYVQDPFSVFLTRKL